MADKTPKWRSSSSRPAGGSRSTPVPQLPTAARASDGHASRERALVRSCGRMAGHLRLIPGVRRRCRAAHDDACRGGRRATRTRACSHAARYVRLHRECRARGRACRLELDLLPRRLRACAARVRGHGPRRGGSGLARDRLRMPGSAARRVQLLAPARRRLLCPVRTNPTHDGFRSSGPAGIAHRPSATGAHGAGTQVKRALGGHASMFRSHRERAGSTGS
jgi:hypothetical protein